LLERTSVLLIWFRNTGVVKGGICTGGEMKLSTGPDIRWKVELSDGTVIEGSRKKVLLAAVAAWKRDEQVMRWIAPGGLEANRSQRRELIQKDYEEAISRLAHNPEEK
jgi:hypothetical protein